MFGSRKRSVAVATAMPGSPDPMMAAKVLSNIVFDLVVKPMKVEHRIPSPFIAQTLGALAGVAAQFAAFKSIRDGDPAYTGLATPLVVVGGADGLTYLYGDAINRPVLESPRSVWSLVGGITQHMGKPVPDVEAIAGDIAGAIGDPDFDRSPDLPADAYRARDCLEDVGLIGRFREHVPADLLPAIFALAYQRMVQTDNDVDPSVDVVQCARVMMHSTIAMSKLQHDLGDLTPRPAARAV